MKCPLKNATSISPHYPKHDVVSVSHMFLFVKKSNSNSQEVHIAFINSSRGLACCVDLPNLAVLSTDQTFRPREDAEGGGFFREDPWVKL